MPLYQIQDKNTGKTYEIEAATPEEADKEVTAFTMQSGAPGQAPAQAPAAKPGLFETGVQAIGSGASMGTADEMGAFWDAMLDKTLYKSPFVLGGQYGEDRPFMDVYHERRQQRNEALKQMREQRGGLMLGGEIAGGLTSGGLGLAKSTAGRTATQALPRLMGTGAATGAAAAAGHSEASPLLAEERSDFAKNVASGAATGAAFAPVIPGVTKMGQQVGRGIHALFRRKSSITERARRGVVRDLMRGAEASGKSVQALQKELDVDPDLIIADLGGELRQLTRAVVNTPGSAAHQLKETLKDRTAGEYDRIVPYLSLGITGRQTHEFKPLIAQRAQELKTAADGLYAKAYKFPVKGTVNMQKIFRNPLVQEAYKKADKFARADDVALPEGFNMQRLDWTIRTLNRLGRRSGASGDDISRLYFKQARNLVDEISEGQNNKAFTAARKVWTDLNDNDRALEQGSKLFKPTYEFDADELAKLSQSEKLHHNIGVMRAVMQRLGNKFDTADLSKEIREKRNVREAVKGAFFGDKKAFRSFMDLLDNEEKKRLTWLSATGGSSTAQQLSKLGEMGNIERAAGTLGYTTAMGLGSGHPFLGAMAGKEGAKMLFGLKKGQLEQLASDQAKMLMSRDIPGLLTPQRNLATMLSRPGFGPGATALTGGLLAADQPRGLLGGR